ncbi:MAG TPA: error-prone DNA polymerase [Thermoleophilaceae bacterium]|nr:error-prone DNA polymerase [Thermoleophilaceae bacterium]
MPYVELHTHSAYSFLDGASLPVELAAVAAEQGYPAMGLTDHDGLHGAMEFAQAAKPLGLRPITGAELTLDDGSHLTLLCESREGYRNLCRLITRAHEGTRERPAEPTPPSVSMEDVERHAEGLVCLSGCARDGALAGRVEREEHPAAAAMGRRLLAAFGPERLRVEIQRPFARHDRRRNRLLAELAGRLGVPCVATGNVHAHARSRVALQDAFVAARLGTTLDESEPARRGNVSHVLASPEAMAARFPDHPEAVHESGRIAERLEFDIMRDLGYRYPGSEDGSADRRLAEICEQRLHDRYENGGNAGGHSSSLAEARARLEEELRIIRTLKLSGFFLLHRDMLELAREVAVEVRGPDSARALLPPGRGRGSSVSSIVCYLTGLSHIDPIENRLLMGRFLNEEIAAMPDIDLDFPRDIREVLIPRVIERYGEDRAALVSSFACYRTRGAVRDFAKALGLPPGEVERAARSVDPWSSDEIELDMEKAIGGGVGKRRIENSPRWQALVKLVQDAHGLPRHVSQHPGGMVISTEPLCEICPIQPAAMTGRQIVQWDKDSCSDAGFLKIDLLGLGMLSAVERCVEEIASVRGERIDLSRIPFDDREVYGVIQRAETTGVFQIESRAQMQMLKQTLPETLDDLTVQVALVRPGPILGGAVHPYIERRKRLRADPGYEVPYEHPLLEPVLRDTLGSIVFQDQVIETSMSFAGFSAGEAEGLRRAMSRRRSEEAMRAYEQKFIDGAMANGASRESAEKVYSQIVGFSGFGFPKAHSAAFGLLAYQSTWLRVHYGPEFLCGLLNEQPMGFYPPDSLVHEAQRRAMTILPPDVLASDVLCKVERSGEELAIRMGLGYVLGVREADVRGIVEERERNPFSSLADLAARCSAQSDALEKLAWAGACDSMCSGRREALWVLGVSAPGVSVKGGVQLALPLETGEAPTFASLTPWERMVADYGSTHVTLREHPLELLRPRLPEDMLSSRELEQAGTGGRVRTAGLVVARQRPSTANGVTFMLLEDEHGTINLIVPPPIYDQCRLAIRTEPLITAEGRLERRSGTTNVIVDVVSRLERPDMPQAEVRHIEPRRVWSTDDTDELRAVAPSAHSFGRRGR